MHGQPTGTQIQKTEAEQFERIPTIIFPSSQEAAKELAVEIVAILKEKEAQGKHLVLGLATGSTPVPLYGELVRLHQEEGLSFKSVITFNLDEYYPISADHRESYRRFMQEQLFDHIDIPAEQIHIPNGSIDRDQVFEYCRRYEEEIIRSGGIDLQILGIGMTGHIGFNEPGSNRDSRTRLITLDRITRQDAARDFLGLENVPRFAITMGVNSILRAKRIVLMAWGEKKAGIIARAVEGQVTDAVSASFLQEHPHARFFIDESAATELTRKKRPWLVGPVDWTPRLSRCAVNWLVNRLKKPVLKLVDEDYNENGLSELVTEEGPAYTLNIRIFNEIQHTISGWPGGKPDADDSNRPEKASPYPKRVAVFSPEPFDDVFGMGGTVERLVSQGHEVHIVYQTSGNLAVPDGDAKRFLNMLREMSDCCGWETQQGNARDRLRQLEEKGLFGVDSAPIREVKTLIRRNEAREAAAICSVPSENIHFQDLRFYEEGRYRQFRPSPEDIRKTASWISEFRPHQIYMTGKNAVPASVHFQCFQVIEKAFENLWEEEWVKKCSIWLYRVYDEKELEPHEIDMAVPMSPGQLNVKIRAIQRHQSQISQIQSNEIRNREIARLYDGFGLAEYEAIEIFQHWHTQR